MTAEAVTPIAAMIIHDHPRCGQETAVLTLPGLYNIAPDQVCEICGRPIRGISRSFGPEEDWRAYS